MIDIGMIHGRFQPFHNGHLDYLKNAIFCILFKSYGRKTTTQKKERLPNRMTPLSISPYCLFLIKQGGGADKIHCKVIFVASRTPISHKKIYAIQYFSLTS